MFKPRIKHSKLLTKNIDSGRIVFKSQNKTINLQKNLTLNQNLLLFDMKNFNLILLVKNNTHSTALSLADTVLSQNKLKGDPRYTVIKVQQFPLPVQVSLESEIYETTILKACIENVLNYIWHILKQTEKRKQIP